MESADILIINALALSMDGDHASLTDPSCVRIRGNRIESIDSMMEGGRLTTGARIIDAGGRIVMPGLVNTHCHAPMSLFRGMADDLPLQSWLMDHIFPAEAATVNPEMVFWCTKLSAIEMVRSGTTLVADSYFLEDDVARALEEVGMRAVAAQGVIDFPAPGVPDPAENVKAAGKYIERVNGSRLVSPAVFCHSPYTCSPSTIRQAKELARELEVLFFIHAAETKGEQSMIIDPRGDSPIRHLDALGVLDEQTVCVHAVWLDDVDIDILVARQTRVATCPQSNMKLASGVAPIVQMMVKGVAVGLGTDGPASNNRLDLFREMEVGAKLHKVNSLDPTVLPASKMLAMATREGAAILGCADAGILAPGKLADMIIVDQLQPHLTPFYGSDSLVYAACGGDVRDVIIDGRIVMRDRKVLTCNEEEVMARVNELSLALRHR